MYHSKGREMSNLKWTHAGKEVTELPEGTVGFVYMIVYEGGKRYIGKKLARSLRKKPPLKGMRKNARRMVMTEHNWKDYLGSSKDTEGYVPVAKYIITFCTTKRLLTYYEAKYQFQFDVLQDERYLNRNILGTMYRNMFSEETE